MAAAATAVGLLLALGTGGKVLAAPWDKPWHPDAVWLGFVTALVTVPYGTKRLTWKPESPQNKGTDPPYETPKEGT